MKLERFDPPGFLEDYNDEQRARWSETISDQLDAGVLGRPDEFDFDAPREQFYNPMQVETGPDAQSLDISWVGFPRNVEVTSVSDLQRWRKAETSRTLQDEYCEWSVERDPDSGYLVATSVPEIDAEDIDVLQPKRLYEAQGRLDEYESLVERFKAERTEFLQDFPSLSDEIVGAVG